MGRRKSMLGAAQTRDPKTVYETVIDGLSECFDATSSARDKARLGSEIMKAQAKLDELSGAANKTPESGKPAEVTRFEVLAERRSERRKAAAG